MHYSLPQHGCVSKRFLLHTVYKNGMLTFQRSTPGGWLLPIVVLIAISIPPVRLPYDFILSFS
jgi:hypothetical protein